MTDKQKKTTYRTHRKLKIAGEAENNSKFKIQNS